MCKGINCLLVLDEDNLNIERSLVSRRLYLYFVLCDCLTLFGFSSIECRVDIFVLLYRHHQYKLKHLSFSLCFVMAAKRYGRPLCERSSKQCDNYSKLTLIT